MSKYDDLATIIPGPRPKEDPKITWQTLTEAVEYLRSAAYLESQRKSVPPMPPPPLFCRFRDSAGLTLLIRTEDVGWELRRELKKQGFEEDI